ncbi:hypothetical protein LIER_19610 [Lithospermum erythrorhizon]|uniref:Uncharacterized protein n=1 Tax=Lithospermum erythrorhizon TaxID=34254 RepID=A0AAV3QLH1_LITER
MVGDIIELRERVEAVAIMTDLEDRVQWRVEVGDKAKGIYKLLMKAPGEKEDREASVGYVGLYRGNGGWRLEFEWMMNVKTRSKLQQLMLKVASASVVYFVWRERHRRVHGMGMKSEGLIVQKIVMGVSDRLSSLRGIKCVKKDWEIAIMWGIHRRILT